MVVAPSGEVVFTTQYGKAGGYIAEIAYPERPHPTVYNSFPWLSPFLLTILYLVVFLARRKSDVRESCNELPGIGKYSDSR